MVAAANTALSATADGNQKKPGFPGFIPPGATPQQTATALAARSMPNVLAGTGLGMGDPMRQLAPIAPAVGGGLAPAFNSGTVGENARYNALPQDNAQNAGRAAVGNVPALPSRPKPASAGVGGIPTGGPTGWTGGATQPAPKTAFGDLQSTIQNQVEKAVWGSTITPSPSTGLPSPQKPSTAPVAQPYRNEGQNYPAGGKVQSPAVTTAPAGAPQRNAAGALTSLGAGTDVGDGIKKYVVDGKTLYSNMGDEGQGGNLSLMNRGAPTAQNMAAMDALVNRSTAKGAQAVQRLQFQDQVAQAQAINAQPIAADPRAALDITSHQYQAARVQNMEMRQKTGESPAAYQTRMQAMAESQRLAQAQASGEANFGLERNKLAANTKQADAQLGLKGKELGMKAQQLENDLQTGAQTREEKQLGIASSRQLADLRARFAAETDPAKRTELSRQLTSFGVKFDEKPLKDNYLVVGGGQEADPATGALRTLPQTAFDLRTGKQISAAQASPSGVPATYEEYAKVVRAANPGQSIGDSALKDKYAKLTGAQK